MYWPRRADELVVKPKMDLAFKKIFSENINVLRALIAASLDIAASDIRDLTVENTEIVPDDLNGKFCRLDVKATMRGRIVDIEIQLSDSGNFRDRALYYWSLLFAHSLKSPPEYPNTYDSLPEAVVICFIDFKLFPCEDYHSKFVVCDMKHGEILTDKLAVHFFELCKLPAFIDESKDIELWLKLIKSETLNEIDYFKDTENAELSKAAGEVIRLNADGDFKKMLERREEQRTEEWFKMSGSFNKGREEGQKEGIIKGEEQGIKKGRKEGRKEGIKEGIKEGRKEGIQEGRKEGIQEGQKQGRDEMIAAMRKSGMSEQDIDRVLAAGE